MPPLRSRLTLTLAASAWLISAQASHAKHMPQEAFDIAAEGKVPALERFLTQRGLRVNDYHLDGGKTLLKEAVRDGNFPIARFLLKIGADPNIGTDYGILPLHYALLNRDVAMIQELLRFGAQVDAAKPVSDDYELNTEGLTPLQEAATQDKMAHIIDTLWRAGADLAKRDPINDMTPLMLAISHNKLGNVRQLLALGRRSGVSLYDARVITLAAASDDEGILTAIIQEYPLPYWGYYYDLEEKTARQEEQDKKQQAEK
ncbi:ankyrin repeat domain-containing protein [Magnetofaba australis]|uniref:Uncharacterized protein n=1 Tax=Magnetofaba australis IT-1 TaxID=1434232 RepID=A0A1Y2K8S8_9PROT|nr:ankyrin repeat domain-containing protein [Magnetofaba australis]OSM06856.1 hypothetical protein MAIT1_00268 [Magnetofaba australis IT-1]